MDKEEGIWTLGEDGWLSKRDLADAARAVIVGKRVRVERPTFPRLWGLLLHILLEPWYTNRQEQEKSCEPQDNCLLDGFQEAFVPKSLIIPEIGSCTHTALQ